MWFAVVAALVRWYIEGCVGLISMLMVPNWSGFRPYKHWINPCPGFIMVKVFALWCIVLRGVFCLRDVLVGFVSMSTLGGA